MDDELRIMQLKVVKYDCIVGFILTIISGLFFKRYVFPIICGLTVASVNFVVTGSITKKILLSNKYKKIGPIFFGSKVSIICFIAFLLMLIDPKFSIGYIFGFISHFVSIVSYGISIKNK